jgi:hypothetical protein
VAINLVLGAIFLLCGYVARPLIAIAALPAFLGAAKAMRAIHFALEGLRFSWSQPGHVRATSRWFRNYSKRMSEAGLA